VGDIRQRPDRSRYYLVLLPPILILTRFLSASALSESPKATVVHLAFSALSAAKHSASSDPLTFEALLAEVQLIVGQGVELPEDDINDILGEM
jgi:hypothetical protein